MMLLTMLMPGAALAAAPATPVNISPASGETDIGLTHEFVGSAFSDADVGNTHYASQWQITATSGVYTSPVFDSGVDTSGSSIASPPNITIPAGYLLDGTIYYWHVRYQDSTGDWSAYSTETSFTTISSGVPHQPSNISPRNAATNISLTPTLESSGFSAANITATHAASQWQVTTTTGVYTSPVIDSDVDTSNLTTNTIPSELLSVSTTYYWHVRHQDSYGRWSAYSTETSFTTTSMQVPATPGNASPASAATGVSVTPTLTGSEFFDPDAGDTHAASQWQISATTGVYTSPVFDSLVDTANKTQITVPSGKLSYNTIYYWHVKYQDSYGNWSAYSTETSFTTETTTVVVAVQQPVNESPFGGATDISPDQKLEASAFQGAAGRTHYASYWQVAGSGANQKNPDGSYKEPLYDSRIDPSNKVEIAMPAGLVDYGKTYYWHVKYQADTGEWSAWSEETSFTIIENLPPSKPGNLEPTDLATGAAVVPVLKGTDFSDSDTSAYDALTDSHAASQWQVTATAGDYTNPVWDSGVENPTTSIIVPAGNLAAGTKYFWRVRYQDSHENWSGYSAETWFTTKAVSAPVASFSADKASVTAGTEDRKSVV